ncbi:MAG: hypothetical protein QOH72_4371 [Solirubrobacteraceae bacterium]|jgi:hypothetical protein|nr:hypothetical protein [Solirubrobacteraceae bacterium]
MPRLRLPFAALRSAALLSVTAPVAAAAPTSAGPEAISGDARAVFNPPTAAIDPITRRPLALLTDFAATEPLVSVRPPTVP